MEYCFKSNSGISYPASGGIFTETGLGTGIVLDSTNLPLSRMQTFSLNAPFTSGYSVLVCQAKTLNFFSGQTVTGTFTGCIPIGLAAPGQPNAAIKLLIRSVTTDATAATISSLYSGIIGYANGNMFGKAFTGAYNGATMTGLFALSMEIGLTSNAGPFTGTPMILLGDSMSSEAKDGATSGYAWFIDSNNLTGVVAVAASTGLGWVTPPDFRVSTF